MLEIINKKSGRGPRGWRPRGEQSKYNVSRERRERWLQLLTRCRACNTNEVHRHVRRFLYRIHAFFVPKLVSDRNSGLPEFRSGFDRKSAVPDRVLPERQNRPEPEFSYFWKNPEFWKILQFFWVLLQ